jgi:hypothetical protein
MERLEVSGAVRPLKWPLGIKWLMYLKWLCAEFHVPFTGLSLQTIRAPNYFWSNYYSLQYQLFAIIRPFLSEDKTDGPLDLHPKQGCNSCSRRKMAPIRSYLYTHLRFTDVIFWESVRMEKFANANCYCSVRSSSLLYRFLPTKATVACNRKPGLYSLGLVLL